MTIFNNIEFEESNDGELTVHVIVKRRAGGNIMSTTVFDIPANEGATTHLLTLELPENPFNANGNINIDWGKNWKRKDWSHNNTITW